MSALVHAESRGHLMAKYPSHDGREQWACKWCAATLLADERNPNGWGSALEQDCRDRLAA